jgi:hypothetical protein
MKRYNKIRRLGFVFFNADGAAIVFRVIFIVLKLHIGAVQYSYCF